MKRPKCSESEALHKIWEVFSLRKGSNGSLEDGLVEYQTVRPNTCILKSFKFLENNLVIHFI